MKMDGTKTALYAAVGAPVVATRKVTDALTELRTKFAGDFRKEYGTWATEGEKVVGRIADQKLVEDFTSRVDVDNISEQVGRLRGQLEDLVATWRQNFNPEKPVEAAKAVKVEIDERRREGGERGQEGDRRGPRDSREDGQGRLQHHDPQAVHPQADDDQGHHQSHGQVERSLITSSPDPSPGSAPPYPPRWCTASEPVGAIAEGPIRSLGFCLFCRFSR